MKYKGYGSPFSSPNPTLAEFKKEFEKLYHDITIDGIKVISHNLDTAVSVDCINSKRLFKIVGLSFAQLGGCGCPYGIRIEIEEEEDEEDENA